MNSVGGPTPLTMAIEAIYSYFKGDREHTDFMKDLEDFLAVGETGHPDFSGEIGKHFHIAAELAQVMSPAPEGKYRPLVEGPGIRIVIDRALRIVAQSDEAHKVFGYLDGFELALDKSCETVVITGNSTHSSAQSSLLQTYLTGPVLANIVALSGISQHPETPSRRFVRSEGEGAFVSLSRVQALDVVVVTLPTSNWSRNVPLVLSGSLGLSASEIEVLELMALGKSNVEIARERFRSVDTVKSQTQAIFRKLGVASRLEAVQVVNDLVRLAALSGRPAEGDRKTGTPITDFPFAHDASAWRKSERDGRQLSFVHYPLASGSTGLRSPVLMFHGLLQSPELTADARKLMQTSGFEFLGVSKPGYGATDHPPEGADFLETCLEDARKVCDDQEVRRSLVLGHLFGSLSAIRYCLAFPERVDGLVLCAGYYPLQMADHLVPIGILQKLAMSSGIASKSAHRFIALTAVSYLRYGGSHRYLAALAENSPGDCMAIADPEVYGLLRAGIRHVTAGGAAAFLADTSSGNADWSPLLSALKVPTIILHGTTDPAVNARLARIAASHIPGSRYQEFAELGQHILHAKPEAVLSALEELA